MKICDYDSNPHSKRFKLYEYISISVPERYRVFEVLGTVFHDIDRENHHIP